MYAIVVWVDEDPRQVSVVPKLWLNDDETKCFWPPPEIAKKLKLTDFQNLSLPALDSNWSRHNVRCLKMEGVFVFLLQLILLTVLSPS
jgi:hypothetical protein